jgi:hypothetical protein
MTEKYLDMLFDSAEAVLSVFGFNRSLFGYDRKNDYLNGDPKEYECSSNLPDTYCSLYRSGYEQGWNSQEGLGRPPGSDPQ